MAETIHSVEFISILANRAGLKKKKAKIVYDVFLDIIEEGLCDGKKIQFRNFGAFEIKHRAPRYGRNIDTGGLVTIEARNVPVFLPAEKFKDRANKGGSK